MWDATPRRKVAVHRVFMRVAIESTCAEMVERLMAPDCKSGSRKRYAGSNPALGTSLKRARIKKVCARFILFHEPLLVCLDPLEGEGQCFENG